MSQLVAISSPASGREMIERAAMLRRSFYPRGVAQPVRAVRRIQWQIVYAAPLVIERPPKAEVEMLREEAAIAAVVGPRVRVADILQAVAEQFDVRELDILSERRNRRFIIARHVCMFLARELTVRSLQEIGTLLGRKDHSSVFHGIKNVEKWVADGSSVIADLDAIRERFA